MVWPAADIAVPPGTRLRIPRRTVLIFTLCVPDEFMNYCRASETQILRKRYA